MRKMRTFSLGLLMALGMAAQVLATEYQIDASHSNVFFKVKHLGISTVTGKFDKFDGTFTFDEKNPKAHKAEVTIDATTVDTQNEKRDAHLKGADFFDAAKYPVAKFSAKKASAVTGGKFQLSGNLTLHGVTKPVVLEVEYTGSAKDPWGNDRSAFSATAKINRKDFGINWNKALDNGGVMVSDDVWLTLEIEGVAKKAGDDKKKK